MIDSIAALKAALAAKAGMGGLAAGGAALFALGPILPLVAGATLVAVVANKASEKDSLKTK